MFSFFNLKFSRCNKFFKFRLFNCVEQLNLRALNYILFKQLSINKVMRKFINYWKLFKKTQIKT